MISIFPILLKNYLPVRINPLTLLVVPVMTCVAENCSILLARASFENLRERLICFSRGWRGRPV